MAAGASGAAAAAARRKRIQSSIAFGVVTVESAEFLRAISLETEPLVVRSQGKNFWGGMPNGKWRYLAAVKGLTFLRGDGEELELPDDVIVIDSGKIKVPSDL
ncbi:MAG: hypothetical protein M3N54_07275 [Acidobacteriota bacterium]|nr:hypothetical protein [Acidobacteriota bacterium]